MNLGSVSLAVLAAVSLLWTLMLILVMVELRHLSWRLQEFIRSLEMELKPAIVEAREAIRNLTQVAHGVADTTTRLQRPLGALEEAGENIRITTGVLRSVFGSRMIPVAGLVAGLRTGLKVLWQLQKRRKRGGSEHE